DRPGRVDRLDLDWVYACPPIAGGLVEDPTQLSVYVVTAGERVLERQRADHVSQRRYGYLLDRLQGVGDFIRRGLGVVDREVQDGVDLHDQVVRGDHRLRWEGHDLLAQIDQRLQPVDEGHQDRQPGRQGAVVAPQALDDSGTRLRDDPHGPGEHDQQEDDYDGGNDGSSHCPTPLTIR